MTTLSTSNPSYKHSSSSSSSWKSLSAAAIPKRETPQQHTRVATKKTTTNKKNPEKRLRTQTHVTKINKVPALWKSHKINDGLHTTKCMFNQHTLVCFSAKNIHRASTITQSSLEITSSKTFKRTASVAKIEDLSSSFLGWEAEPRTHWKHLACCAATELELISQVGTPSNKHYISLYIHARNTSFIKSGEHFMTLA